jgi:hypothetical protein
LDNENPRTNDGSTLRASAWMFVLSMPLVLFVPPFGHFFAGLIGGRIAKSLRNALVGAIFPCVFWAITVALSAKAGIPVKADRIFLPQVLILVPPLAILAGALTGAAGRGTKLLGLAALVTSAVIFYNAMAPIWKTVTQLQASQSIQAGVEGKTCPDNLRRLHKAILLYADQWDDMLPPADRWVELIKENVPDDNQLRCPSVAGAASYGYAMNSSLGGKKWKDVPDAAHVPLFYDSSDLKIDAHDSFTSLPSPGRHDGHNNVIYLDGRVVSQ